MERDDDKPDDSPAGDGKPRKWRLELLARDSVASDDDIIDMSSAGSRVEDVFSCFLPSDPGETRAMLGGLFGTTLGAVEVGLYLCDQVQDSDRKLILLALTETARCFLVSNDAGLVAWGADLTDKLVQTARFAVMLDTARDQAQYIADERHCGGVVSPWLWDSLVPPELRQNVIEPRSASRNRLTRG